MTTGLRQVVDDAELRRIYDGLLVPSFPASELVGLSWLLDGVARGRAHVVSAVADGRPVGAAVTEELVPGARLLSYLAVAPDQRGTGVGSRLLDSVLEEARGDGTRLLLAEVERPDRHAGSAQHGDPAARVRFYARRGARVLDLPYVQAPIRAGAEPVPGMLLLVLHAEPGVLREGGAAVDGPLVAAAVEELVGTELDDPWLTDLRRAARRRVVAAPPASDWRTVAASVERW